MYSSSSVIQAQYDAEHTWKQYCDWRWLIHQEPRDQWIYERVIAVQRWLFVGYMLNDAGKSFWVRTQCNPKLYKNWIKWTLEWFRGNAVEPRGCRERQCYLYGKGVYDVASNRYVGIIIVGVDSKLISGIYTNVDELTRGTSSSERGLEPLLFKKLVSEPSRYFIENKMYINNPNLNQDFQFAGANIHFHHYHNTLWQVDDRPGHCGQRINARHGSYQVLDGQHHTGLAVICVHPGGDISRNITGNVRLLLQGMTNFSMDFTHKAIVPRSEMRSGLLAEKFNSMAEKIGELIHTIYTEKLLSKRRSTGRCNSNIRRCRRRSIPTSSTIHWSRSIA